MELAKMVKLDHASRDGLVKRAGALEEVAKEKARLGQSGMNGEDTPHLPSTHVFPA
jgi:hypothetical protein